MVDRLAHRGLPVQIGVAGLPALDEARALRAELGDAPRERAVGGVPRGGQAQVRQVIGEDGPTGTFQEDDAELGW
jgi:hypothetical protein